MPSAQEELRKWVAVLQMLLVLAVGIVWGMRLPAVPVAWVAVVLVVVGNIAYRAGQVSVPKAEAPLSFYALPEYKAVSEGRFEAEGRAAAMARKAMYACRVVVGLMEQANAWPDMDRLMEHVSHDVDVDRAERLAAALRDVVRTLRRGPGPEYATYVAQARHLDGRRRAAARALYDELNAVFGLGALASIEYGYPEDSDDDEI